MIAATAPKPFCMAGICRKYPAAIAERYMFDPTERSMPAVSRTKIMPTAITPVNDACLTMLPTLSGPKKLAL